MGSTNVITNPRDSPFQASTKIDDVHIHFRYQQIEADQALQDKDK